MIRALPIIKAISFTLLLFILGTLFSQQTVAAPIVPPDLEKLENSITTGSAGIATGDPDANHAQYSWPFPFQQMGHLNSSYQLYSSDPAEAYFHHGIDMIAPEGTPVYTPCAGQVVNIENYSYPSELYWEVAILDPQGYVWQYHHIEQTSIPQSVRQAYAGYMEDNENGGFIAANTHIGNIVPWPVESFGYIFNHIHLNILAAGDIYLNPLEFLDNTYWDIQAPQIQQVGIFTGLNNLQTSNTIPFGTDYSLFVRTRDLFMSQVFYLPPHRITYVLDGSEDTQKVWNFHSLPGGASDSNYVNQYFLPGKTKGDYDIRDFYVDLGFQKDGSNPLPTEPGLHSIDIEAWDYAYNRSTWTYKWVITQPLPDNGCATGQGVTYTTQVAEDIWVEDVNLGLVIAHEKRGQVKVTLRGPQDTTAIPLVLPTADVNLNYNILIDDASNALIDNSRRDDAIPPYYRRSVGPVTDGSLDNYAYSNAKGIWQVFICDSNPGLSGAVYGIDLRLSLTADQPTVYLPLVIR